MGKKKKDKIKYRNDDNKNCRAKYNIDFRVVPLDVYEYIIIWM